MTWADDPVVLPAGAPSLYLVKRVRDEAHRFAITYHRQLRGKAMTASVLDDIEGVGPKRKKALLKAFGSRQASCAPPLPTRSRRSPASLAQLAEHIVEVLGTTNGGETEGDRSVRLADDSLRGAENEMGE